MKKLLRVLLYFLAVIVFVPISLAVVARFSDGPIAVFAGGPLEAGELVTDPVTDWSFAADIPEVEFQLVDPPRSRTTWIVVRDGKLYIPCGMPELRLWKQWPHEAMIDGRSILRIDDKRYPRQAVRVTDEKVYTAVAELLRQKYPAAAGYPTDTESLWIFELAERP